MSSKRPTAKPSKDTKPADIQKDSFSRLEAYLQQNQKLLLLLLPLVLGFLFAALTFDVKISEGNDDAMYIEAAHKYAVDFTGYFYTANAPLYPMVLGIVTIFSGLNLTLFKIINIVFFLLHLTLMYYAFRRRIPLIVLWPVLLFSSLNSYLLYYASQTYTEMLFLTLQALFFLVFFNWYEKLVVVKNSPVENRENQWSVTIKAALSIGSALILLTLCKNIAIGMLGAVTLFLLLQKQYRMLLITVGGYLVTRIGFEGLKAAIWGAGNQYGSQGAILLQKDAYNPAAGQEDISGFITRFFENFNLYISKRLFQILGFKDPDSTETKTILSVFVLLLVIFAAWRVVVELRSTVKSKSGNQGVVAESSIYSISNPQTIALVLIYVVSMLGLTFLVLQTKWDQPRLIMVYVPLLFMSILYGFYSLLKKKGTTA